MSTSDSRPPEGQSPEGLPSGTGRGAERRPRPSRPRRGSGRASPRATRTAPARKDSARALALRVIRRVVEKGAYSNLALAGQLADSTLSGDDRRFAADLVYGTLRRRVALDAAIAGVASRPVDRVDPQTLSVLLLGAYQLLFTRVPSHAAVNETVALASGRSRGFVNAVLRKLASGAANGLPAVPDGDGDAAVSLRTGLSAWAVAELRRVLPPEEVEPAAAALAAQAPLSLRTNVCMFDPGRLEEVLRDAGFEVERGAHDPSVLKVSAAVPALLPGFREGWFAIQDEASVLVTRATEARTGQRILDACAAPGGKAADLACTVGPDGLLVAADVRPGRVALVQATALRLGVPVRVLVQDARQPAIGAAFDVVLVDAPCSGLGAARRRPELLWRPAKTALARMARLQVAILEGVADLVRPGGRLVYSVCTFPRAETDAAVRSFLAKRPDFEPAEVPGPDGPATSHRLWPHRHGTDGMFYAGLRRRVDGPG